MTRMFRSATLGVFALSLFVVNGVQAEPTKKEVQALISKGYDFLKAQQGADGSFSPQRAGPGITALVASALLRAGYGPDDPVVSKALGFLEKNVQKDGGIYNKFLANYTTCVAVMALKEANKDGKYDAILKNATTFLKTLPHGGDKEDPLFGGAGYDGKSRPDMSNTAFFVEAMIAAGVPKDDPAITNALQFISRCQNLPGETNPLEFAKKTSADDKGGLVYVPTGDKKAQTPEGGLRSRGAMTYSGLKSFLYAGVDQKDVRVKAAIDWIARHYTLEENPGMGKAGLYYYYHTFAKAMSALGMDTFPDSKGTKHDWKQELYDKLKKSQEANGSWVNAGDRAFGESDPNLATAFAILSLSYTMPSK